MVATLSRRSSASPLKAMTATASDASDDTQNEQTSAFVLTGLPSGGVGGALPANDQFNTSNVVVMPNARAKALIVLPHHTWADFHRASDNDNLSSVDIATEYQRSVRAGAKDTVSGRSEEAYDEQLARARERGNAAQLDESEDEDADGRFVNLAEASSFVRHAHHRHHLFRIRWRRPGETEEERRAREREEEAKRKAEEEAKAKKEGKPGEERPGERAGGPREGDLAAARDGAEVTRDVEVARDGMVGARDVAAGAREIGGAARVASEIGEAGAAARTVWGGARLLEVGGAVVAGTAGAMLLGTVGTMAIVAGAVGLGVYGIVRYATGSNSRGLSAGLEMAGLTLLPQDARDAFKQGHIMEGLDKTLGLSAGWDAIKFTVQHPAQAFGIVKHALGWTVEAAETLGHVAFNGAERNAALQLASDALTGAPSMGHMVDTARLAGHDSTLMSHLTSLFPNTFGALSLLAGNDNGNAPATSGRRRDRLAINQDDPAPVRPTTVPGSPMAALHAAA